MKTDLSPIWPGYRGADGQLVHPETLARIQNIVRKKMIDKAVRANIHRLQGTWDSTRMTGNLNWPFYFVAPTERFCEEVRTEFARLVSGG